MPSAWLSSEREDRGAYTSVAQNEDTSAERTAQGEDIENGSL